jgi:hypothetical protein
MAAIQVGHAIEQRALSEDAQASMLHELERQARGGAAPKTSELALEAMGIAIRKEPKGGDDDRGVAR